MQSPDPQKWAKIREAEAERHRQNELKFAAEQRIKRNLFENWMRPALHRMITASGVARVGRLTYILLSVDAEGCLKRILKAAVVSAKEAKRNTIKPEDVSYKLAGYTGPFLGKKDDLFFAKATFERSVRHYAKAIEPNIRFSPDAFPLIQKFLEAHIFTTINLSKTAMQHARRNTLLHRDVWLVTDSMRFCPIADK